ncbi:MAG: GC-type dockerin domain-anchored protein [Phycisphaerales bacterium]
MPTTQSHRDQREGENVKTCWRVLGAAALMAVAGWGSSAAAQAPAITDLGAVGPESRAYAVSASGQVVVGESGGQAFVWSQGTGMIALGGRRATGVSANGEVISGYAGGEGPSMRSVRWTAWSPGALQDLSTFGDGSYSAANGVAGNGSLIIGNAFNGDYEMPDTVPYRWTSAGATQSVWAGAVTAGSGPKWGAQAASHDGLVIVGNEGLGWIKAFRWTPADGKSNFLSAYESSAQAVSTDGGTVAGYYKNAPGNDHSAYVWRAWRTPQRIDIPDLPGGADRATANALSGDGAKVAGWGTGSAGQEALIWDETRGTQNLREALIADGAGSVAGWVLTSATGVSANGQVIVGYGTNPAGQVRAWRVTWPCYANCDQSVTAPALNINDFSCFLARFAQGDPYANCDNSTTPPVFNVADFSCFLSRYAAGCP